MRSTILIIALALPLSACKPDHHDHGEAHAEVCTDSLTKREYADEKVYDQPGVQIGQLTRCPISGSVFRVSESSPSTEQKGKTYYTCCAGCISQLEKDFARRR